LPKPSAKFWLKLIPVTVNNISKIWFHSPQKSMKLTAIFAGCWLLSGAKRYWSITRHSDILPTIME